MIRARPDVEVAGGDRAAALRRVQAVGLGVGGVVEEVGAARGEAERRRTRRGSARSASRSSSTPAAAGAANTSTFLVHCFGRAVRIAARSVDERPVGGVAAGVAPEGSGTADIALRLPVPPEPPVHGLRLGARVGAGRRLRRTWPEDLHAHGRRRHAPGSSTAGGSARTPPGPTRTARSTRRSRRSASPGPRPSADSELDELLVRLQRELFVVGRRARDRAREPRASSSPGVSLVTDGDGRRRSSRSSTTSPRATSRRPSSCSRARTASPPRSTSRARSCGGPSGSRSRPPTTGWLARQPGRAVPQPSRRPRLHAGPLAGGHVPARPRRPRHLTRIRRSTDPDLRRTPCPSRSPSSPRPPTGSRPSCSRSRSAKGARVRARRRRRSTPRSAVGSTRSSTRPASKASSGETLAVPTAGKLRAKAAILVGVGDPAELTLDGLRRAAAAVARRASKAASVATTLADRGPDARRRRRRAGRRRGVRARRVPVPRVQGRRARRRS